LTPLTIALFDACSDGASRLAESLSRSLAESGIDVNVAAFDAAAPKPDTADVDAVFLRGLGSSGHADLPLRAADDSLRAALSRAGTAYQVVYGSDEESLAQLMRAIENVGTARSTTVVQPKRKADGIEGARPWMWQCDKCSDPQCEQRLLTALLQQREAGLASLNP
jgi:hypothetical protein